MCIVCTNEMLLFVYYTTRNCHVCLIKVQYQMSPALCFLQEILYFLSSSVSIMNISSCNSSFYLFMFIIGFIYFQVWLFKLWDICGQIYTISREKGIQLSESINIKYFIIIYRDWNLFWDAIILRTQEIMTLYKYQTSQFLRLFWS